MARHRCGLAFALVIGVSGCAAGGPQRASDIQNLNAINDDISAVTMTRSENTSHVRDPNKSSTLPRSYEIHDTR